MKNYLEKLLHVKSVQLFSKHKNLLMIVIVNIQSWVFILRGIQLIKIYDNIMIWAIVTQLNQFCNLMIY